MENIEEFRKYAHEIVDWIAEYYENIESYPVKSKVQPGEIFSLLPEEPPAQGESMQDILSDFDRIILPGITHWQSPGFHAYFPANTSFPSVLGEMLTSALAAQCMKWDTSPAATELEEKVMTWLKGMLGLPAFFQGVIQDTASTSTLTAILSAREKFSDFRINREGIKKEENFRVYCSTQAHSSVEKAVKIAGIGSDNLVKIDTDDAFRMDMGKLREAILNDIGTGKKSLCVVIALGTTSSTAIDSLSEAAAICSEFNVWLHVDAAYAGSALILPEYRWMIEGIEGADSFVFNPHKWLFTNFDCSAYFVKNKTTLVNTFQLVPEYLKSQSQGKVNDYSDWGIQLGRRFRALKLWFVLRSFGVEGLQEKLRYHLKLADRFVELLKTDNHFEILTPVTMNVICFRYLPEKVTGEQEINKFNEELLHRINSGGKIYLTHTKLNGIYAIRMVIAQTNVQERHVNIAWNIIRSTAGEQAGKTV